MNEHCVKQQARINRTHPTHSLKLSVLLNVQTFFPPSSSPVPFREASLSNAKISWIPSLLTNPQGCLDLRTHALYETHNSWPEDNVVRNEVLDVGRDVPKTAWRCNGRKENNRECARPIEGNKIN